MDGQQRALKRRQPLSLNVAAQEGRQVPYSLLDSATAYMFANQVPLLELGRIQLFCVPSAGIDYCPEDSEKPPKRGTSAQTTYLAFNDESDILGLELPPYIATLGDFGRLVNISVNNPGA